MVEKSKGNPRNGRIKKKKTEIQEVDENNVEEETKQLSTNERKGNQDIQGYLKHKIFF